MDSYITWPYQIADHNCRITWVYNKTPSKQLNHSEQSSKPKPVNSQKKILEAKPATSQRRQQNSEPNPVRKR